MRRRPALSIVLLTEAMRFDSFADFIHAAFLAGLIEARESRDLTDHEIRLALSTSIVWC